MKEMPAQIQISDKRFGFFFSFIFFLASFATYFKSSFVSFALLAVSLGFVLVAWRRPSLLSRLKKLWFEFGHVIHQFVSPLILGVIYFGVLTPMAILKRRHLRQQFNLNWDAGSQTYWFERQEREIKRDTLHRQY